MAMDRREKLAVGLVRGILVGAGEHAIPAAERIISRTGAIDDALMEKAYGKAPKVFADGGVNVGALGHKLKELAFGDHALDIAKQRFTQGGLVGKGGILHGAISPAMPVQAMLDSSGSGAPLMKRIEDATGSKGTAAVIDMASSGMESVARPFWAVGLPAYGAYHAYNRDDAPGVGRALGEGLGWAAGMNAGVLGGNLIANGAIRLGEKAFSPTTPDTQEKLSSVRHRLLPRIKVAGVHA